MIVSVTCMHISCADLRVYMYSWIWCRAGLYVFCLGVFLHDVMLQALSMAISRYVLFLWQCPRHSCGLCVVLFVLFFAVCFLVCLLICLFGFCFVFCLFCLFVWLLVCFYCSWWLWLCCCCCCFACLFFCVSICIVQHSCARLSWKRAI